MSKNCFTICIDMDDTIENLLAAWIDELNMRYHLDKKVEDVVAWEMSTLYPELTDEQIFAPLFCDAFWKTVQPKADAVKYVQQLINDGHDVYICTSSHYATIKAKVEAVLTKHFPAIRWDKIIVASNKQMIRCDIMIDDGPHNLINGEYVKILLDAPHNKSFDESVYKIKRVHTWEEIYTLINNLDWFYSIFELSTIEY